MRIEKAPKSEDVAVAERMSERIVAAAAGRVERIILFGSRARGDATPDSDYDLLVVTDTPFDREEEWPLYVAAHQAGRGEVPEVWTVSADCFRLTRDIVGWPSYLVCRDGIVIYERQPAEAGIGN